MRGASLARLVLALAAPLFLAAALSAGYAQRPSAAEAGYRAYLLIGGDPAGLCGGGHPAGHDHCNGCQAAPPALAAEPGALPAGPLHLAAPDMPAEPTAARSERLAAAPPRGPPGRVIA
jgi:hypothetical protein